MISTQKNAIYNDALFNLISYSPENAPYIQDTLRLLLYLWSAPPFSTTRETRWAGELFA